MAMVRTSSDSMPNRDTRSGAATNPIPVNPIPRISGKAGGILKGLEVHDLAAPLIRHLAGGAKVPIRDVILGNVVGPGGNVARLASLEAGIPLAVPGMTIDRQCSAGLEAIRLACHLIQGGAGDAYIAGGAESVSTSPFPRRARFSPDEIGDPKMPEAAELVAERFFITKEAIP